MERESVSKWVDLIVTKPDGSEVCALCMIGSDPLSGSIEASKISVVGNSYLREIIERQGPITGYRLEELTWQEIVSRGYRENPPL